MMSRGIINEIQLMEKSEEKGKGKLFDILKPKEN